MAGALKPSPFSPSSHSAHGVSLSTVSGLSPRVGGVTAAMPAGVVLEEGNEQIVAIAVLQGRPR
jgi:hypothetical protein